MNAVLLSVFGLGTATIVALQGWILLEIISLKLSLAKHDVQINRIVSDAESEKGTRKRVNGDLEERIRLLEHKG